MPQCSLILLLLPLCIGRSAGLSPASQFSLASVRQSLIRQEETIIFALIERAQFRRNDAIYQVRSAPISVVSELPGGRSKKKRCQAMKAL